MYKYIGLELAISLIKQYGKDAIDGGRYSLDTVDDCIELANRIEALPSADVVPVVHGRWVTHYRSGTPVAGGYVSTCCDMWNNRKSDYCPNCGAKMDIKNGGDGDAVD